MSVSIQKAALRKHLLEKRDATSAELREISSDKISQNLKQIDLFNDSQNIASYFPIGSEVNTNRIMLDILEQGKNLLLPKVVGDTLESAIKSAYSVAEKIFWENKYSRTDIGKKGLTYL